MRLVLTAAIACTLAGCATTKLNYKPQTEQISFPTLDQSTTVAIGEAMIKQGTSTLTKGIFLDQDNNIENHLFSKGFYPQIGENEKYTFHSYQLGSGMGGLGGLRITGGLLGPGMNTAVSLRATKGSNQLCVDTPIGRKPCDTEHSYQRTTRPIVGENNFQQTLLYNGRVGDRVKIGYREFSGDVARPAFSNEVEYDLSQSTTINYRGARIDIVQADNEKIEYRVLSNFNLSR